MKRSRASVLALLALSASCSGGSPETDRNDWTRERLGAGEEIVVDASAQRQRISGFGASSAWTGGNISPELADAMFSEQLGIGLSLLRMQIKPNGSTDETATARLAIERGAKVWAAPWSPPGDWKTSGTTNNGGSLLPEHYQDWADRLATWVKDRADDGVPLYAISAQNEPNWTANWDTCRYTPEEFRTFIRDYLAPTLAAEAPDVKLMAPESIDWNTLATFANPLLADPDVRDALDIVAVHAYGGIPFTYQPAIDAGKEIWETEVSYDGGEGIVATLETARQVQRHLVDGNVNAFHYWWLVSNDVGGGLSHAGELEPQAYGLGHYSKFVRPGFVRLELVVPARAGLTLSAYTDPESGRVIVVGVNETDEPLEQSFRFENVSALEIEPWLTTEATPLAKQPRVPFTAVFDYALPPLSVTTLVVTNEPDTGSGGTGGTSGTGGESGNPGDAGAPASNGGEGGAPVNGIGGTTSEAGATSEPQGGRAGSDGQPSGGEDSQGDAGEPNEPIGGRAGSGTEPAAGGRRVPAPYSACLCATPGKPASGGGVNVLAVLPLFVWLLRRRRAADTAAFRA